MAADTRAKAVTLDCINNVAHDAPLAVGHCHPTVVQAAHEQNLVLNTNSRYLHDNIVDYAQRLSETLPEQLSVFYFLNSGSEANDLALRLARQYTGHQDVVVLDHAYHGHLSSLIDISPYKFRNLEHLTQQKAKHPIIGDVRGTGLFIGVDLIKDETLRTPATEEAEYLVSRLKENYILLSIDGPGKNILKFKPPMCFNVDNAQHVVAKLDDILTDMEEKVRSCETLRIKHPPEDTHPTQILLTRQQD